MILTNIISVLLLMVFLGFTAFCVVLEFLLYKEDEDKIKESPYPLDYKPLLTYKEVMDMLDDSLQRCFRVRYLLDVVVTQKKYIKDFQGELREMTNEVLLGLSPEMWKTCEYYMTRKAMSVYVIRNLETLLFQFIRDQNITVRASD